MAMEDKLKKLAYISPENYSDVDIPVIMHLNKAYDLKWYVIFNDEKVNAAPKFSIVETTNYAKTNKIKFEAVIRKGRIRNIFNFFLMFKLIRKVLKSKPDLIYIESFNDVYFLFLSMLFFNKKNVIIGIHDVIPHLKFSNPVKDFLDDIQRKFFKYFHLFSQNQALYFNKHYKKKQSFVVPMCLKAVDTTAVVSSKNDISGKPFVFLFWGNIRYNKGVDILIKAAEKLYENGGGDFIVKIAGRANDWEQYEKLIKHPGLFYLHRDFIPNNEIPQLLQSADFLILPYRDVTQSGPLLYAYNYKLPIIASNLDGFKEYITDGYNGFLFENEDSEALCKVMNKVLLMDTRELKLIKEHLCNFIEDNISTEFIISKYNDMFNSILVKNNKF